MIPELFRLGPIVIHSFGFALAVAFLLLAWLMAREFKRLGYNTDIAGSIILGAMIGGVLGAKVYFLVDHWSDTLADPRGMILSGSGLTYYGGLLGGALGVTLVALRNRIPIPRMADIGAPLIALGYGVGRIGCFLNGDDYGRPSDVPWAMAFPKGTPPTTETVHPTQLYETALSLLIFGVLWMRRRQLERHSGLIMGLYLLMGGAERFVIEYWRLNAPVFLGFTVAQVISLGLMLLGAVLTARALASRGAVAVRAT